MPATTGEGTARLSRPRLDRPSGVRAVAALLRSCHPAPAAAVTVLAALLAVAVGLAPATGAVAVAAVAAGQLSIGWSNDRLDVRRDRAAGRRDKPLAVGAVRPGTVGAAACSALLVCVPLSLWCGPLAGAVHLGCVAAGWAYNLRLKRTVLSWLPYALAFGLLPAFLTLSLPGGPWPSLWWSVAAALLGTGAHFANVLPDIEDDLAHGVVGLPHRLGRTLSAALAALLALASCAVLTVGAPGPVTPLGLGALGVTLALCLLAVAGPSAPARGRLPFLAVMVMAGVDAVLLVVAGGGAGVAAHLAP
ncbi:UbiA family prenyltransferase [Streptomyces sp. NPDC048330]|uniref:UbiA family prenyltransferase n=1 Tax=Streptomyces sp. NPDC048330 TaxID=3365533 RepID=UPI003711CB97